MSEELDATQPAPTRTMRGHAELVLAVAFFKDGRRVITGSLDHTLRIWDVQKGALVGEPFKGHCVRSVAISPDDRRIASGGEDKTIIIWDVKSKQMIFDPLVKHTGTVNSVCFSPNGKRLASGSDDCTIVVWDAEIGAVLATLENKNSPVQSVTFSPDGLKLASGSSDHDIRVWRTDNVELLFQIKAHEDWVRSVVWSSDGQQLVSVSSDSTAKFWNSSNGDQIGQPCTGHTRYINSLAISSDGSIIATASLDKTVRLWNTKTHIQPIGQVLKHTAEVDFVTISPGGELLVTGAGEGKVLLWSIDNTLSTAFGLDSSYDSFFAHRSKAKLRLNLYVEALCDAEKVIELNPSSHVGYELKHAALHRVQRYDDAIEAFKIMLSKFDDAPDPQIRELRQQYIDPSAVDNVIRRVIPLHLLDTSTGRLCDREVHINAFVESKEYREILSSSMMHATLQVDPIKEAVSKYIGWVMLSHRWERKEPRLRDIQGKTVYGLDPVGGVMKLQSFCKISRDAGYRWAWSDTCCIDQSSDLEVQESVNSMFVWYRYSALTIVYLPDILPFSKSGALAKSVWNTRGWTIQETLAPRIILFFQADWTLYLNDRSPNHKESAAIMHELEDSTGINARALVAFRPGMIGAREKLQWASTRVTTLQEDSAYSLFGIFGVHLPVIYGEKKHNALGRLLQEIIAQSGDITALDWVGRPSHFNSCLPADITLYEDPPCILVSLSEDEIQSSVSSLRNTMAVDSASTLYILLGELGAPRFANSRLNLPCIVFHVTEVRHNHSLDQEIYFTYEVKADGLRDLSITTKGKLTQFSPARPTLQKFLLIRPWDRNDLELPDFADEPRSMDDWPKPLSPDEPPDAPPVYNKPVDSDSHSRALRLIVRLGQPFGALLLAQQRDGEYKRIASDHDIIAQVKDVVAVHNMMDVRTLEIS